MQGDTILWPFSGDLKKEYHRGDGLSLQFKLIEEYSDRDYIFENINDFSDGYKAIKNGNYLNINNYIIK